MRSSQFILKNMREVVAQWETFAATQVPAAEHMDRLALRDHAQQILEAIARDITTAQTPEAQTEKSIGRAPRLFDASETAAQTHAFLRAQNGFNVDQLAAEYRVLRATVLRLWAQGSPPESFNVNEVIRFNEAVDMRSPLQPVQMTARYLAKLNAGEDVSEAARKLITSGAQMQALLDDLVEFNRTMLGLGIQVTPQEVDVPALISDELAQLRVVYPQRQLQFESSGVSVGRCDPTRLRQLIAYLVINAVKYGARATPVQVTVSGDIESIRLEVKNFGSAIEPVLPAQLFDPLKRGPEQTQALQDHGSLGLGLYIVREIARAHGGEIEVRSDHTATVFAVCLPRRHT